jgi:hypothetical protein
MMMVVMPVMVMAAMSMVVTAVVRVIVSMRLAQWVAPG